MSELEHISTILPRLGLVKELKNWVAKNMEIVCDTREKENRHITGSIEQLGGKCVFEGLKTADYAYKLCGVLQTDLVIERKNSLTELSANITKNRERFENELQRAKVANSKIVLLIENDDFNNLFDHTYRSMTKPNAFLASLFTYQERYGVEIVTINHQHVGRYIYNRFYYHVREIAKNQGIG